jgi:ABC-type transporter Mla subunit MlaD
MNSNALTVFVAVTSAAVVLQMGILLALYLTVRRSTAQMESIALDMQRRVTPLIENTRDVLADATPKLRELTANLAEASASLRKNSATLGDIAVDMAARTRNKVARADDMLSRTLERVEKTTGAVQNSVMSPVRHVSGILQGISVGIGAFRNQKREVRNERQRSADDEGMFI